MAILAEDVRRHLDEVLVCGRRPEVLVDPLRRILLQLLGVGHDLDDAVPHLLADVVARRRHEAQDGVEVPFVLARELFRQDRDLEDELFPERIIGGAHIAQELVHDRLVVGRIAHRVEQVEAAPPNRDVFVAQGENDRLLVALDVG
jgi:hypothetical protein